MIDCLVQLRHNPTGVVITQTMPVEEDNGMIDPFAFSDGYYLCDCARAEMFVASGGVDHETACGFDDFDVRVSDLSGNMVYQDGEWPE